MIEKSTELNESIFVLYHVLNSIHQNFDGRFPNEINRKIEDLKENLIEILDDNIQDDEEIIEIKYYQKFILGKNKK